MSENQNNIQTYLDYILSKVYGKEVRQAIVDAINQCYADATAGITPVITTEQIAGGTRFTVTVGSVSTYFDVMNGISPQIAVANTASDMTDTDLIYVYAGSETGYVNGDWYYYDGSAWQDGGAYQTSVPIIDNTLSNTGQAADAKKTGDEINDLRSQINNSMPYAVKQALDTILHNIPFKNTDIYTDELATFHAWATSLNILSISAVFNQGSNVISTFDTLDSLRQYLTVTASYSDGTSGAVSGYTLSGELNEGTNTITVAYEGKTATFNVNAIWILKFTGADLIRGYLNDSYISTDVNGDYCTSYEEATSSQKPAASKRLSMATFIPIEYGYNYIFNWKATNTLMLSAFAYSEAAMTKYANREAFNTSTDRASISDGWNAGTSDGEYMTMTATPPELIGGSPTATMRFNFKTDPEVAFSENKSELTEMILTREVVS